MGKIIPERPGPLVGARPYAPAMKGFGRPHLGPQASINPASAHHRSTILFDRTTKQITNHPVANALLVGPPPRKDWEQFYKL